MASRTAQLKTTGDEVLELVSVISQKVANWEEKSLQGAASLGKDIRALDEFKLQSGLTPLKFYRSNRNPLSTTFIMAVPETQAQAVHRSLWQYTHHHGCQIFHEYGNIRCLHFRFSQPKMGCQLPFFPSTMTFNEGIAFVRIIRSRRLLFNAFR